MQLKPMLVKDVERELKALQAFHATLVALIKVGKVGNKPVYSAPFRVSASPRPRATGAAAHAPRPSPKWTKAARAKVARRMKAYWAKRRKAAKRAK